MQEVGVLIHFLQFRPFGWEIRRSLENTHGRGPVIQTVMLSLLLASTRRWTNVRDASDFKRLEAHVTPLQIICLNQNFHIYMLPHSNSVI